MSEDELLTLIGQTIYEWAQEEVDSDYVGAVNFDDAREEHMTTFIELLQRGDV